MSADQQAEANRLSGLSGDAFDREYMSNNVTTHEKDVTAARVQATQGNDADIKALAAASLPILEIHLAAAQEILSLLDPTAFLVNAYQDGLKEIQLSQLALQKSGNNEVKQFAQRMIDDHTQANQRIAALAKSKGASLPSSLNAVQQSEVDELSKFSGADFDKTYMDQNVTTHVADVRQVSQQAQDGKDADVKALAQELLPTLTAHLASALDIDSRIEPSFLYMSYQDSLAEVRLANLALLQGASDAVKSFAQKMITDHTALNKQIQQLAQQKNLALPLEMSPQQLQSFVSLLGKSGQDFDREYMDINVSGHQQDVEAFSAQAQDTSDADIAALARNALPILQSHLTQAQTIRQQLGGTAQTQ